MVNLELYKIFVLVAREKNITKASEILHISQPAVTTHIKNLENDLNIKLFNRTNHGIELTEDGKKIYEEITEPIEILNNISLKYINNRSVNLGIHSTMLNNLFSKKISKFYQENESIKINTINNDIEEMIAKLENQELDLVISKKIENYLDKKIEYIKLGTLHDILITNNESKLANTKITIDVLKENVLYMPRKTSPTVINFLNSVNAKEEDFKSIKNISYNTMIEIIKNNGGVGLVTKEYVKKELEDHIVIELKTEFDISKIEYGIYINKNNRFSQLNKLINTIKND